MDTIAKLSTYGQTRLLAHLERTDGGVRERLLNHLQGIDLDFYFKALGDALHPCISLCDIEPFPVLPLTEARGAELRRHGHEHLARGRVGYLLLAGGQGSRLGFDHPKGMLPIGVVSKKSLFQIHFEKIAATGRMYGFTPHVFVMTSQSNHGETESFLQAHDWFGLSVDQVHLFAQGMLPAVDDKQQLILTKADELFLAPDGHGGVYRALLGHGMFEVMRANGVADLWYFQVDNPLVDLADAGFVGAHIAQQSEFSFKVLPKRDASEGLGILVRDSHRPRMIEYSEMPADMASQTDNSGQLRFRFGSIGIHLICAEFAERVGSGTVSLPFHPARKKVPYFDGESEQLREPENANAQKMEQFVFDAVAFANNPLCIETVREEEFFPVKNSTGEDSLESCQEGISALGRAWFARAGRPIPHVTRVEIDAGFAVNEAEFIRKIDLIPEELLSEQTVYIKGIL